MHKEKVSLDRFEDKAFENRNRNIQNANGGENSLCGQLMLVSTVFLTVSIVVLGSDTKSLVLSSIGKLLLVIAVVLILSSMGAGIRYYFENMAFYKKWAEADHKDYELLRDSVPEDWSETTKQLMSHQEGLKIASSDYWLKVQICLLFFSAMTFVSLLIAVLFNMGLK